MTRQSVSVRTMSFARWGPWIGVVVIFAIASMVAVAAGLLLALSWWAVGFETGWWPGDSNMNDGEGAPMLFFGSALLAISVGVAASGAGLILQLVDARRPRRVVLAGCSVVVAVAATSTTYFIVG